MPEAGQEKNVKNSCTSQDSFTWTRVCHRGRSHMESGKLCYESGISRICRQSVFGVKLFAILRDLTVCRILS